MRREKFKEYSAMDIATVIISIHNSLDMKITNLRLQKLLYYIQVKTLLTNNRQAFVDPIEAWRHGPVIRDVYRYYRYCITSNIVLPDEFLQSKIYLEKEIYDVIIFVIYATKHYSDWELVEKTQQTYPWIKNYVKNMNCIIPEEDLIHCELNIGVTYENDN